MHAKKKAMKIKFLILDVDGALSDGKMIYSEDGKEMKIFHVRDGKGIHLAKISGIEVAFVTAEKLNLIKNRAKKLGIRELYMGIKNKLRSLNKIQEKHDLKYEEIAMVGDDINDIPTLEKVGLPIAVGDAVYEVKKLVRERGGFITKSKGGNGAVREAIEFILKSKGVWNETVEKDLRRQKSE